MEIDRGPKSEAQIGMFAFICVNLRLILGFRGEKWLATGLGRQKTVDFDRKWTRMDANED